MRKARENEINKIIGSRIRAARKMMEKSQEEISNAMGLGDRQILSNIEAGKRKVSADEMIKFMSILNQDLEFLTDPYIITEQNVFSWRAEAESNQIERFESKVQRIISAYARFSDLLGIDFNPLPQTLPLTVKSSFEDAARIGERVAERLELGPFPYKSLRKNISEKLEILVLYLDAPHGISGAACHWKDLRAIVINRNESPCRKTFDLAHELFHILTWDEMKPDEVDPWKDLNNGGVRREKLANNFAAGILMPSDSLFSKWNERGNADIHRYIMDMASEYGVSGEAMYYRLNNLSWLSRKDQLRIDTNRLHRPSRFTRRESVEKLYANEFALRIYDVLEKGLVSRRKIAEVLDTTVDEIADLLKDYDLEIPY